MRHNWKRTYISAKLALFAVLIFMITVPAQLFAFSATGEDKRQITLSINHPSVSPGTTADIEATVLDQNGKKIENPAVSWVISDDMEQYLRIAGPASGPHITVVGLRNAPPPNTSSPTLVPVVATFKFPDGIIKTAVVNIGLENAPLPAGPIPPGLNPEVDVMWDVVSQSIVGDNFGRAIRKNFYAVEIAIGNNTGYDLQIASVGFEGVKVKSRDHDATELTVDHVVPSTGFRMSRGTSERAKELYPRTLALNSIRALGPVLTGFTPFLRNVNHRSNFAEGVNIFSNPFEKGVEIVWPDLSLEELNRLQDSVLRDDITTRTVVPNNTQVRTLVLIPKDLLNLSGTERDDPAKVMQHLGRLVLIGNRVQFINRERVVAIPTGQEQHEISGTIADACGNGVPGVTVRLRGPADFSERTATTNELGEFNFGNLRAFQTYVVTPKLGDKDTFKPTINSADPTGSGTQTFVLDHDLHRVDFIAQLDSYSITGRVRGDLAGGVKIILNGQTEKTTATDGSFSLDVPKDQVNSVKVKLSDEQKKAFEVSPAEIVVPQNCNKKDALFTITKKTD